MKKNLFKAILGACAVVAMLGMTSCTGTEGGSMRFKWFYSPDEFVLVQEYTEDAEGFVTFGRQCLYDVHVRQVHDISEGEVDEEKFFGYDVSTEDYDRIHAGNVTEEELASMKYWMAVSNDPHPEVCEVFYNNDGKVIGHHHTVDGKIVEPSVKCAVKVEVKGQSLENAYHVIAYVNKENQSE